jgi:hypothetical protein
VAPAASTARYAPVESVTSVAGLSDVWINFTTAPFLNLMVGQMTVPFSLENRTADEYVPFMERNVAIRGFAIPFRKDLGGMLWGQIGGNTFTYQLGVFGGDGQNRPSVDNKADFIGSLYARPFASLGDSSLARSFQIGVSARHGDRDPASVGYDYPAISTGQGFLLWTPTYTDHFGRLTHVIPSGAQNTIGGELRAQSGVFALQGEAYYVNNNTREATDGYQLATTERLGRMRGVSWYAMLSVWPVGDAFMLPDPGMIRLRTLDLSNRASDRPRRGIEVHALVGGINANYQGATRQGVEDAKAPTSNITIYQYGVGVSYWHTRHVRLMVNYNGYHTPGSGTKDNAALVPDNLIKDDSGKANTGHILHEVGARLQLSF